MKSVDVMEISAMTIQPDQSSPYCDDIPLPSDPDGDLAEKVNLEALKSVEAPYASLIREFPDILKSKFRQTTEDTIFHRIHTEGEPTKAKVHDIDRYNCHPLPPLVHIGYM